MKCCSFSSLMKYMIHTTVILDPGAGTCIDDHGDDVLIPSTCSKRQDVFTWKCGKTNVSTLLITRTISQTLIKIATVVNESSDPLPEI